MEIKAQNCKQCIRFATCKFVEENDNFAKTNKMYSMFEYLESNNLKEIFYRNASSCKFFIDDEINADVVKEKIKGANWGFTWLRSYVDKTLTPEFCHDWKGHAIKAIDGYIKALNK